jgi:hypothetical protein
VYWYKDGRVRVNFGLTNSSDAAITNALSRALLDRVTVVEASQAINTDFHITQVHHEFDNYNHQETRIGAEKTLAAEWAVWGTVLWGTGVWVW